MDVFQKCRDFSASLGKGRQRASLFYRAVDPIDGRHAVRNGRRLLMLGSNDYLGLTHDPRVKQAESDQIVKAIRDKKREVQYVVYPDEGHGFARPENRLQFFAISEEFLAKHLGGRAEPAGEIKGATGVMK